MYVTVWRVQEKQVMRQVAIPREVYTGTSNQLFDYLAKALAEFIKEQEQVMSVAVQQLLLPCQSPPSEHACDGCTRPRGCSINRGGGADKQRLCQTAGADMSNKGYIL